MSAADLDAVLAWTRKGGGAFPTTAPGAKRTGVPVEVQRIASRGIRCLTTNPHSKVALLKAWEQNATDDIEKLREMALARPECGWAIVADDLLIIDVDDPRTGCSRSRLSYWPKKRTSLVWPPSTGS